MAALSIEDINTVHYICVSLFLKYVILSYDVKVNHMQWQTVYRRLCLKRQVINLVEEGYTPEQLDAQPVVAVEDW